MARRLGFLLQALLVAIGIVVIRLSWAPVGARQDLFVIGVCVAVAFVAFIVGFTVTTRCLEMVFGKLDESVEE